jgi:hypothetical protein
MRLCHFVKETCFWLRASSSVDFAFLHQCGATTSNLDFAPLSQPMQISCPARRRLACPTCSRILVPFCSPCPDYLLVEKSCQFYASGLSFGFPRCSSSSGFIRRHKSDLQTHQNRPWVISSGLADVITGMLVWNLCHALGQVPHWVVLSDAAK